MARAHTIKSIAEKAGVATATVARVLHGHGYVAEATREKVLKAVQEADYRINHIARSLKRNRSNVIGHILKSITPNPFYVMVARGVEDYCRERGYTVLTYNVQDDASTEAKGVETFLNWRADAIIFTTPTSAANVELARNSGRPVVQVERPQTDETDRIVVDNYRGAQDATTHLLELGHRRIGFVGQAFYPDWSALSSYVETERFGGYRDAMVAANAFDEKLVYFGRSYSLDQLEAQTMPLSDGYAAMQKWMAAGPLPTAVFASSDFLASGVLQAAQASGIAVPRDLSVIGYDDTIATLLAPLLTTVRMPAYEIGLAAAQLAIERLSDSVDPQPRENRLETTLIHRASVAPPPKR